MSLKIALLGDICLNGKFDLSNNINYQEYFKEVASYLSGFDCVLANLETPLTNRTFTLTCKGLHLRSSLRSIELLNFLNVSAVSLANNHIYDYGAKGLEDTIDILTENNIDYYGIKDKQLTIEDKGNKISIGGYCCYSSNPSFCHEKGVNPLTPQNIAKKIKSNHDKGFFNLISLHWGDENIHYPRDEHIQVARYLSKNIPLIIHGHHTHVIQGIENTNESFTAYSLGNFCTDDVPSTAVKGLKVVQQQKNKESIIVSFELEGNKIVNQHILSIFDDGTKIQLENNKTSQSFDEYSLALKKDRDEYIKFRNKQLKKSNQGSESKRTVKWFLRRLNYYFIGAYIKGKMSKLRYNKAMKFLQGKY